MMVFNDPKLINTNKPCFEVTPIPGNYDNLLLLDRGHDLVTILSLMNAKFNIAEWYKARLFQVDIDASFVGLDNSKPRWASTIAIVATFLEHRQWPDNSQLSDLEACSIQIDRHQFAALQRNAGTVKEPGQIVPKPIVITVSANSHPCRALLDTGSLSDFISGALVDQLRLKKTELSKPVTLHLAMQGSRSKINSTVTAELSYEGIKEQRTLDVININSYDLILGTPWLYQHKVNIGFTVEIASIVALPMKKSTGTKFLASAITPTLSDLEAVHDELHQASDHLCKDVNEANLPPFRAINHTIPLIDENKIHSWRPSHCPEVFRGQWAEKRDTYLKSGQWQITSAENTVPVLLIPKPRKKLGEPPELCTVIDLRERNSNTRKLTSPLPDMEGVLQCIASKPFRSALDLKAAYKQI
jgi:hypothetical protein